jgi:hypothetical protein
MKEKIGSVACANQTTNIGSTMFIAAGIHVLKHGDELPGRSYPMTKHVYCFVFALCCELFHSKK